MKIVDVCAFYSPHGGGVRTYIERKLIAGPRLGHEIVVIAPADERRVEERGPGARIVYLPAPRFPLDRGYHYFDAENLLHETLDRENPDFVEASSPWRSAEMVARWQGWAPRSLIMHADPLSAYAYRWFGTVASRETIDRGFGWFWRHLRRLDRGFDMVVSANDDLTGRLRAGGLHGVETNPLGIAEGVFSPRHRDAALRAQLLARCGLPADATLLIGVGRLAPEKRWPMVIDACTASACQRPVGLVIVGDGRERKAVIRHIGDHPHVRLLEPVGDRALLARLLASADALIHGCEAETFGLAAAEARASGLPVIAPDRGGAADQARGAGELYRATDAADAARAIVRLIDRLALARSTAAETAPSARTMDAHFRQLFDRYTGLAAGVRRAA